MAPQKRGPGKKGKSRISGRNLSTRVKTAKGRKSSSTRWLQRQLNDPYVAEAERMGFRSRAAFKILELDDRFGFLKPGHRVVDLGCAPGGWAQVAAERVKSMGAPGPKTGKVVGIDLQEIDPIPGTTLLVGDFLADDAVERLNEVLAGQADAVLSDMAAAATGHTATDHLRIMALLEAAADFAAQVLAPGGVFIGKVLRGGTENQLLAALKRDFSAVKHVKPPASRADSAETYVVATGFRGKNEA